MRFMETIRFKPKPEFLDDFLIEYHKVTGAALKDGSIDSYFTVVVEDEIVYISTFNYKEPVSNTIQRGLDWLDNFTQMLQLYSNGNSNVIVESSAINNENRISTF
jgi:hypothetical protein